METPDIKKNKTPQNILTSVSKYQKNNKDKVNEKYRNYYKRLKEDPERYAHFKERHRTYLLNKKALKKAESEISE